ncbi:hypothetical protein GPECTOR_142g707 [Gonium pectorale]|uniref:Glycosyl transferase CAP10 domain-containing protein n=1 Tax=Gonium pectorale TaxID=33097 RepID=A0A150FY07_GONPE|nr:hypothetical protein GPECTOR_142g707 [Gonium pectorale]|eukprot:KXZ42486.1 hypothetical protein GPECTOR_142g707 [Gonium pectorale]
MLAGRAARDGGCRGGRDGRTGFSGPAVAFGRWNRFCAFYNYEMGYLPSKERYECPREWLPLLAEQNPDVLDVCYLGPQDNGQVPVDPVPLARQNEYRYLVSTDGWAISSKLDKYLLLGSLIIKADSSRFGYYYDALKPDVHFVRCMNRSKSDLLEVVRWAQAHDAEAAAIAMRARRFAVRNLCRPARLCFYRTLLEELGRRMRCARQTASAQAVSEQDP